jgi:hypothetical protein
MNIEYFKGGNIVSIKPAQAAAFPAIGHVEAYWDGLRDGRLMPGRAEVDPRGITQALEQAFILEKVAPGLARIRIAGMHLNELMSMEVRGMPITALFQPEARREMQRITQDVMDTPAVVRLSLISERGFGRAPIEAQMILMPLRDGHGAPTRIFGAMQALGRIGRAPNRFKIRDVETRSIDVARACRTPQDYAVATAARLPQVAPVASAPRLRLVHDADRV